MEDVPIISVIVPVYNVEKYLNRCVESIINQTFKDFELILVDDGSTDNCPQMCDKWAKKDSRIKAIHKPNGGASSARNVGLDIAIGDFISFVDADDVVTNELLEKVIYYQSINDYDIVEFSIKYITDYSQMEIQDTMDYVNEVYIGKDLINKIFQKCLGGTVYPVNKLYKKCIFKGLRFEDGRMCEDQLITPMIYDRAKEVFVTSEVLYYYYQSENSVMRREFTLKQLDIIHALECNRDFFLEKNYVEENYWLDTTYAFVIFNMAKKVKEKYGIKNNEYIALKKRFRKRFFSYLKNPLMGWKLKCMLILHLFTI